MKCPTCQAIDWFVARFDLSRTAIAAIQCEQCRDVPLNDDRDNPHITQIDTPDMGKIVGEGYN